MKVKYSIHEIMPRLYCVLFDEQYDMCMTFCRWQEFYESNNPKIKNKVDVGFFDIMKDYSKRLGKGIFTYTDDWIGFNLPSYVFDKMHPTNIRQWRTPYDKTMGDILRKVETKQNKLYPDNPEKFYLVAASHQFEFARSMQHEVAHGLYFLDTNYKKQMRALMEEIPKTKKEKFKNKLAKMGYAPQVIDDEIQAYMATGLVDGLNFMKSSSKLIKRFQETFKQFEAQSKFK